MTSSTTSTTSTTLTTTITYSYGGNVGTSVSVTTGYPIYLCAAGGGSGASYTVDDSNGGYNPVGHTSSNVCSDTGATTIAGIGVSSSAYTIANCTVSTTNKFTVSTSGSFVAILIANGYLGGSVSLPSGCSVLAEPTYGYSQAYVIGCNSMAAGTYAVTLNIATGGTPL